MIPVFLDSGARVVAFDWFGFGRSDKPVDDGAYTWDFHRNSMLRFVEAMDLTNVTLVVQDWGGLLGLTLPVDHADRISRLLIMNTAFGVGATPGQGFIDWRTYVANTPDLAVGRLMKRSAPVLSDAEAAAYDAPFPGPEYKAGVRTFPALVPTDPEMDGVGVSKQALAWWRDFEGPMFMAVGAKDPVLGLPVMESIQKIIGCPAPMIVEDGGHFIQEWGREIATAALEAWA
jgi:pimeloyl-ACP methyl ester carboxylesterase